MTIHLSILLWLPLGGALLGALLTGAAARLGAVLGSALALVYAIVAVADFERGAGLQYVTDETWIRSLGVHYALGIDGLNLFLILLATVLFTASTLWAAFKEWERPRQFFLMLGLAHTGVLGALMAQDLALFVVFFDLMLVPFLFLTYVWGREDREPVKAVTKLFIYTLVGSLLMLTAAIATGVLTADAKGTDVSFLFADLSGGALSEGSQQWIFLCFAAAFLVKMPAFPFHGWMPDGYRAMPLPVLAVFSGVLSKVAAYGFLRVVVPFFPDASVHFQELMLLLALASILYGSVMAFTTTDARLVLGYSSIAQLGFIVLGVFALNDEGAQGAILQSVNHGIVVAPAFVVLALLAERAAGSEDVRDMGGIAFRAPVLAALFLVVGLANLAIPGSSNFAGEFLILLGVFKAKLVIAIVASTGVALASVYTLRLFIRAMHNRVGAEVQSRDLGARDAVILVPLVLCILALALYPQIALEKGEAAVTQAVKPAAQIIDPPPPPAAQVAPETQQQPIQIDPQTGQPIDPQTGQPIQIDPNTGQPVDPSQVPQEEVPAP
ncbi:NuoM family protein [Conexibacter sp. SYSU D00693]|uniref:complex I subunit 4 family protein n=1 Tax=Conexibacter sp. SYSU D00693 TaxID=2812560 RepID=UPI001F11EAD0|nr:NADH-quinone oxidoreductase subunit M [Conexibacter sp. SYSU D00693]